MSEDDRMRLFPTKIVAELGPSKAADIGAALATVGEEEETALEIEEAKESSN